MTSAVLNHSACDLWPSWQQQLQESLRTPKDFVAAGLMRQDEAEKVSAQFLNSRVQTTRYYASLVDKKLGPACPIYQQCVPQLDAAPVKWPAWVEALSLEIFQSKDPMRNDPIGDLNHQPAPRLTHRYANRVLLHATSACAVYCRFCFRKNHLANNERKLYQGSFEPAMAYIAVHPEIREVIVTGGDPLSMNDVWWERFVARIDSLAHIKVLRVHSRTCVTLPARITQKLLLIFRSARFHVVVVSHFNHARELTQKACAALADLRRAGVTLLNQAVLMRGINASVEALTDLCVGLYEAGATPYYLHHPDWVAGTFAARPSIDEGRSLMQMLSGRLPGPAVPKYVLDVPGGHGKVNLLDGAHVQQTDAVTRDNLCATVWRMRLSTTRLGVQAAAKRYLCLSQAPRL